MSRFGFGFGFVKTGYLTPLPIQLGAVAWYNFTDQSKIIEGATSVDVAGWKDSETSTTYDLSQSTASAQPAFTQTSGPVVFDGSDYLEESAASLTFAGDMTFALKFKQDVGASNFGNLLSTKAGATGSSGIHIEIANKTQVSIRGSSSTQASFAGLNDLEASITNIIIKVTGTTIELYQDGISKGTGTIDAVVANTVPLRLGTISGSGNFFDGDMYEVSCFQKALTDSEIAQLNSWMTPPSLPWTPANIATQSWFDASDTSTITESGGSVSQWDDKSGNNNHATQGTASSQPTLVTDQLNFDGGDILGITNDPFNGLQNPCIVVLGKFDGSSSWSNAFASYTGEAIGWQVRQRASNNSHAILTLRGTDSDDDPTPSSTTNTDFFIGSYYRRDSSTRIFNHNGTQTYIANGTDTGTILYSGSNRSAIGGRYAGDNYSSPGGYLNGSIKEIIVADGCSDSDVQKIEGYLAWKWGLEGNLDAGHPYKNAAPTA